MGYVPSTDPSKINVQLFPCGTEVFVIDENTELDDTANMFNRRSSKETLDELKKKFENK